ncbi:M56 family metallopeptidase [Hanstruepera marina]|uniref:M56 family metallopeptidase n=1 Tax=Hanstruepera marina TaxID=2873265 RepID=UPI001CA755BE|nr:M56 family metallopeptidase [Hanstruepera marina]
MMQYIIQVVSFQLFFLVVYDVFLKKETFFNWNRVYLLGTAVLSIVIPFIKVESFKNVVPQEYVLSFPTLVSEAQNSIVLDEVVLQGSNSSHNFTWYLSVLLLIGSALALFYFAYRVNYILKLIYKSPKVRKNNINFVKLLNSSAAFSFFNYVFLGEDINDQERESIIKHEIAHIKDKHTLDLLFFEALRIVFWFNPLVYMYQNRMSDLHEFIADSKAVKHDKKQYYENLLSQVFDTKVVSFINPFFKQSLIKKRIIMLQKTKSKKQQLLKFALLIPIVLGMLVYVSCSQESTTEITEQEMTVSDKIEDIRMRMEEKGGLTKEEQEALLRLWIQAKKGSEAQQIGESNSNEGLSLNEVPFAVIDQVPVFPGCETETSEKERKACMNKTINKFIIKNFNTNLAKQSNLSGVQQVRVMFKIGKDGHVKDIRARALSPELEAEAVRVVSMLPTMIPGEHDGKKVSVPYYLPIKFEVHE